MFAGCFGGLPGAGATMRTVVNVRASGRTPISGALHALVMLDFSNVTAVDFTSCRAIDNIIHDARDAQRKIYLIGANVKVKLMLSTQGILLGLKSNHILDTRQEALEQAAQILDLPFEKAQ